MTSPSTAQHREAAAKHPAVRVAVLTISDTRTPETDASGKSLRHIEYLIAEEVLPCYANTHSSNSVSSANVTESMEKSR